MKSKVIEFKPKQKKSNRKKSVPRAETFSPPSGGTEKTALNQPPRHLAWQAHGNFRSPHGPAALHISRKRSG